MSAELERRYRRWLLFYPRPYRRAHGDALVATLLDCAGPGQTRPRRAEVVDLVRGGLRQRFRLPVGRAVLATAVLAAVLLGAFGAAAGSWLGWRTAADLPTEQAVRELATAAAGDPADGEVHTLHLWTDWTPAMREHEPVHVDSWSAVQARERLADAGWRVRATRESSSVSTTATTDANGRTAFTTTTGGYTVITAARDGVELRVGASDHPGLQYVTAGVWPQRPAAVLPLTVLGLLAGITGGWLLTGWAGYRLRRRAVPARGATILTVVAVLAAAPAAAEAYRRLVRFWPTGPENFPAPTVFEAYRAVVPGVLSLAALAALIGVVALAARVPADDPPPHAVRRAA